MKDIPLLLIHGYPFDHTLWFSTIASLGSKAKVIAPDLPGFGKATLLPRKKPSMENYAEFLMHELIDTRHEKVVIAGMSMGGYVALAFAQKYPDKVLGLGLISSQAAADTTEAKQGRKEMIQKIRDRGVVAVTDAIIPKMFSARNESNSDLRIFPEEAAEKAGPESLIWALEAMAARPDYSQFLGILPYPVLIVHGTDDKIVPFSKARLTAEKCRKPIFVEATGAGHATPLEAPDEVATGLTKLMRACRGEAEPELESA